MADGPLDGLSVPVAVVGGGQAGLATSRCLGDRGVEHVVLERRGVGWEWRERRWDSFCLVTPNRQCRLPGFAYAGPEPDGFMVREQIVGYLEAYAASFRPPLHEGVEVTALTRGDRARFALETSAGRLVADEVVVATGGYHRPRVPALAGRLPDDVVQVHSSAYRSPASLPDGAVLVVGTGQSGCQIAEDLHLAGRRVHLAVGSAPRVSRFHRGRDVQTWLEESGQYDRPVTEHHLGEDVRLQANHYETGRDGGRDIDLRAFALQGMELYGHLRSVERGALGFADDLTANLDRADAVLNGINELVDAHIERSGAPADPPAPPYAPVWSPAGGARHLDLRAAGVRSVVWATGFTRDDGWIRLPAFDGGGRPMHARGVTPVPGLSFVGLPWLWTWGSGRFAHVGRDAAYLADRIALRWARAPRLHAAA